ncbi:MAG: hypothetical protein K1X68_07320 [Saprospiraceae bacterium]|nr:hypothetical protein [Saprospiraceae bacterium]MBX7176565.1 hypothetical protein [Saprospiraceae bacterium]HMW39021.1 hypothetical protein [Saprospiraceae bacterium]HMX87046.1 hypothetical protein [Saprospiraceae bacterium]HMZ41241.1 hypothetical protein [Saprospiraceae bacterium]
MMIFYVIALLLMAFNSYNIFTFTPMGGDRAVGQAWLLFILGMMVSLAVIVLFIAMSFKGCFNWIYPQAGSRLLIIIFACITLLLTIFFTGIFSTEWYAESGYPEVLKIFSRTGVHLWLSIAVMIPFYFLIKAPDNPAIWVKGMLRIDFGICMLFSVLLAVGWLRDQHLISIGRAQENKAIEDKYHLKNLEEIRNYQRDKNIQGLLSFSFVLRPKDIHDSAMLKIKERPEWENEILAVLEDRQNYIDAYYYLSGNPLDHPEKFTDAFRQSIISLTVDVTEFLKETNNYQTWSLDHLNIGLMLESIEFHFKTHKQEFRPFIIGLRDAIITNTPTDYKKVKFSALNLIDQWLRKNI